jgi:hypothetical protein
MTSVPSELVIGHRTYRVVVDDSVVQGEQPEDADWQAFSDPKQQLIAIRPGAGRDDEADSVLHEVLHQCLRASGCWPGQLRPGKTFDLEEMIVSAITGPLLRALRDNPELVTYLVARR